MKVIAFQEFTPELERFCAALEPRSDLSVFQTHSWLKHWQITIGEPLFGVRPWLGVITEDDGRPFLLFPLGVRKALGGRVLEFLGGAQSDYHGPIVAREWAFDPEKLSEAWKHACSMLPAHDVRHFSKIASLGPSMPLFETWQSSTHECAYAATLPATFDEFQARLRAKIRSDNRRQRRRLAELGNLRFVVASDGTERAAMIDAMIRQKQGRYRITRVPDMFRHAATQNFYRCLPPQLGADAEVHVSALYLNNEILATHVGAIHRRRYYFLMPTYAAGKFEVFSPGRLLLEHLLAWSIERGMTVFDFTIGGEDYKRDWCDQQIPVCHSLDIITLRGLPYATGVRARDFIRRHPRAWTAARSTYAALTTGSRYTSRRASA